MPGDDVTSLIDLDGLRSYGRGYWGRGGKQMREKIRRRRGKRKWREEVVERRRSGGKGAHTIIMTASSC